MLVSHVRSIIEVNSIERKDTTIKTIVSTIKPVLAQVDIVTWEDIPSYPEDTTGIGATDLLSKMNEDDKSW